ncbi:MAG: SurA N-terminal domain-containing protein, partial [Desulfuromonadales bacterium]|nr:SurA N-terminal domain-containing protein [Desulfuromonadales bacterium]
MLGIMRKYKQSILIKVIFGIIVLSFIGTIFLVWGKGSGQGQGGSVNFAARVDGTKITLEEFQQAYDNMRNNLQQIYGNAMTPEFEQKLGVKKIVLDSLINRLLVRKAAKKMDISVNNDEVSASIASIPAFQRNGVFDFQQYRQALRMSGITPKAFEANQREQLLIQKATQIIQNKVTVSDEDARAYFHKLNDKLNLSYIIITPESLVPEVKFGEKDLENYLQEHQDAFKTPEKINIQYILIDPSAFTRKVNVTAVDVQTYYQKNMDKYQDKDGNIIPLETIKDRVQSDALRAAASKAAFEFAADAVNKESASGNLNNIARATGTTI